MSTPVSKRSRAVKAKVEATVAAVSEAAQGKVPPKPRTKEEPFIHGQATRAGFTRVVSNIKGGVDVQLSPLTALVGPNRSTKTAVLDALRVGLTTRHRVGATGSALMKLVPPGAGRLDVELYMQDGGIEVAVEGTRASASKPERKLLGKLEQLSPEELENAVVTESLGHLLSMSDNAARMEVFRRFGSVKGELTPAFLSESQKKLWELTVKGVEGDLMEALTNAPAVFNALKLEASRREKELQIRRAELEKATGDVLAEFSPAALEAAKLAVQQLTEQLEVARRFENYVNACKQFEQDVAAFKEMPQPPAERPEPAASLSSGYDAVLAAKLSEQVKEDTAKHDMILQLRLASKSMNCCALCRSTAQPDDGSKLLEQVAKRLKERQAELAGLMKAAHAGPNPDHATWRSERAAREKHAELRATLKARQAKLQEMNAAVGPEQPTGTMAELGGQLEAAQARLQSLVGVEAFAGQVEVVRQSLAEAAALKADYETLSKESKIVLQAQLGKVAQAASEAVTKYLPVGYAARLVLDADGKATCSWEIEGSDGQPHGLGAASGSETCLLSVALACAWTEGAPIRVVLLDDTDLGVLDPGTLVDFLNLLEREVKQGRLTQAIVAWTRPEEIPPSWTRVERGARP